jgi:hypothetical protein
MTKILHYGKLVDSEVPITGVHSNNRIYYLSEEKYSSKSINLTFENWVKEEKPSDEEMENYLNDNDTYLIGSWTKNNDGSYVPDKSGEYSAVVYEDTTHVVWSKYTERHALCSPCCIGQADADSAGEFLCYVLPQEIVVVREFFENK